MQFAKYRTFKDSQSGNHADLGLVILKEQQVLEKLTVTERNTINTAIKNHNKRQISRSVSRDDLMYCRLIRDADKLDILEIIVNYYESPESAPHAAYEDYTKNNSYSLKMIDAILNGEPISYADVQTTTEMKLVRMSWVLDMTYPYSFQVVENKAFIDRIAATMQQTKDIQRVYNYVKQYLDKKLDTPR